MNNADARGVARWAVWIARALPDTNSFGAADLSLELHKRAVRYRHFAEAGCNGELTKRQEKLDASNDKRINRILSLLDARLDTCGGVWPRAKFADGREAALP